MSGSLSKPTFQELQGMTVNERLFALGLFEEFDKAAKARDKKAMIDILKSCSMNDDQCEETSEAILRDPKRYGY